MYRRVNINSLSLFSFVLNTSFIKETRSYDFSCVITHVIITRLSLSNSNCFIRNEHLIINETRTYGFSCVIIRLYINMHFSLCVIRQQSGHFATFNFKLGCPRSKHPRRWTIVIIISPSITQALLLCIDYKVHSSTVPSSVLHDKLEYIIQTIYNETRVCRANWEVKNYASFREFSDPLLKKKTGFGWFSGSGPIALDPFISFIFDLQDFLEKPYYLLINLSTAQEEFRKLFISVLIVLKRN